MRTDRLTPFDTVRRGPAAKTAGRGDGFRRESFTLPRVDARAKAEDYFRRFPKEAYMTVVEFWRELDDGQIEFVMRRLPTAD